MYYQERSRQYFIQIDRARLPEIRLRQLRLRHDDGAAYLEDPFMR